MLSGSEPAGDVDGFAGDVAVGGGAEEHDGVGDIVRGGQCPGRQVAGDHLLDRFGDDAPDAVGGGHGGHDDVDQDAVGSEFAGEAGGEAGEGGFGCSVGLFAWSAVFGGGGGDERDAAVVAA